MAPDPSQIIISVITKKAAWTGNKSGHDGRCGRDKEIADISLFCADISLLLILAVGKRVELNQLVEAERAEETSRTAICGGRDSEAAGSAALSRFYVLSRVEPAKSLQKQAGQVSVV